MLHAFPVSVAADQVIVYQAGGLQMGIDDGGAQEFESPLLQIPGNGIGEGGSCRNFRKVCKVVHYLPAIRKTPQVAAKGPVLFLDLQEAPGIGDGGFNLLPVPDNSGILDHGLNPAIIVSGHQLRIESVIGFPVTFSSFQDGQPAQSGLG